MASAINLCYLRGFNKGLMARISRKFCLFRKRICVRFSQRLREIEYQNECARYKTMRGRVFVQRQQQICPSTYFDRRR